MVELVIDPTLLDPELIKAIASPAIEPLPVIEMWRVHDKEPIESVYDLQERAKELSENIDEIQETYIKANHALVEHSEIERKYITSEKQNSRLVKKCCYGDPNREAYGGIGAEPAKREHYEPDGNGLSAISHCHNSYQIRDCYSDSQPRPRLFFGECH